MTLYLLLVGLWLILALFIGILSALRVLQYIVYGFLSIVIDLISRPLLNWIVVVFADKDGNLPKYLYYWQTFDATLYEGQYAAVREFESGNITGAWKDYDPYPVAAWGRYKNRAFWLFRNSCYGFSYYVFGCKWVKADWTITTYVDTPEKTLFIARSTSGHFNVYYHGRFGMLKIGWKAWNMHDPISKTFTKDNWGMGGMIPITVSVSFNAKSA